jgi:two-component system response regulator AtoC
VDDVPSHPAHILIVEDDKTVREGLLRALAQSGLCGTAVAGVSAARALLPDVRAVLLDIKLKDGDGLAFLEEIRARYPRLPVVMATAYGDSERTISAMTLGAFEYLTKPFDLDALIAVLNRAIKLPLAAITGPSGEAVQSPLIGSSATMLAVWKIIGRAAMSDVPVLITGESGTGKELVARAIHEHGPRKTAPFVAINIAALAPTLVESELFGHERGAFTGANDRRAGRFEAASNGTLFLDEIADLDISLQTKLLRVLQDGQFERVGASAPIVSRARIITAASKPVKPGETGAALRGDLFYRLGVLQIELPPLRERKSDIPLLVEAFLRQLGVERRRAVSEAAMERLCAYHWPGNVRELLHTLQRAAAMTPGDVLDEADLVLPDDSKVDLSSGAHDLDLHRNLRAAERKLIERALVRATGNRAEAARLLGIARPQLYTKMRALGIAP